MKYHKHILTVSKSCSDLLADILTKWCWDVAEDYCGRKGLHYENAGVAFMFNMSFHIYNLLEEKSDNNNYYFVLNERKINMSKG